jgi:hypothetical protein
VNPERFSCLFVLPSLVPFHSPFYRIYVSPTQNLSNARKHIRKFYKSLKTPEDTTDLKIFVKNFDGLVLDPTATFASLGLGKLIEGEGKEGKV